MLVQIRLIPTHVKKIKKLKSFTVSSENKPIDLYTQYLKINKEIEFLLPQYNISYINKNRKNEKSRKFCLLTARKRGHYSKLRYARSQIRDLANTGLISGLKKSSW